MRRHLLLPPLILAFAFGVSATQLDRVAPFENPLVDAFGPLAEGEGAILFGGDMLLGDAANGRMKKHGNDWQFRLIQPVIDSAGAVAFIGNQEGPITPHTKKGKPGGVWSYRQSPKSIETLQGAGLTHVSVANNHAEDRQLRGMLDTVKLTKEAGIEPFGAGKDARAARKPVLINVAGTRVAVLGGMQNWDRYRRAGWEAKKDKGGVNLFRHDLLPAMVKDARKGADLVVAYPHWGDNYSPINRAQRDLAKKFMKAGVDAIVGHHSHDGQPWGFVRGKPVVWSLGNMVFGSPGRFGANKFGEGFGMLCRMVVKDGAIDRFELIPMQINNRLNKYQPTPISRAQARRVMRGYADREGSPVRFTETGVAIFDAKPPKGWTPKRHNMKRSKRKGDKKARDGKKTKKKTKKESSTGGGEGYEDQPKADKPKKRSKPKKADKAKKRSKPKKEAEPAGPKKASDEH